MWRTELAMVGGVKAVAGGSALMIWPIFWPELNPETKAVLEAAAMDCWLFGTPGATGAPTPVEVIPPGTTNVFFRGGLVFSEVAIVPGKVSENMPIPPRMTVLPFP